MDQQRDPIRLQAQTLSLATALPAAWYVDPAQQRVDARAVFGRSWQLAGHASAVSGSGDHLVTTIGDLPVIVVRGADGTLRAFHNVCRHRAAPLAWCSGRGARELRCRYHGWTYTLDGQLRVAPEMADEVDFVDGTDGLSYKARRTTRTGFAPSGGVPPRRVPRMPRGRRQSTTTSATCRRRDRA